MATGDCHFGFGQTVDRADQYRIRGHVGLANFRALGALIARVLGEHFGAMPEQVAHAMALTDALRAEGATLDGAAAWNVQIQDTSLADAPAVTIGAAAGAVPACAMRYSV